ncbi:hypothetical protein WR25_09883 [Diploscapter pachys]|uniref:Uncharacterized protein n=1 Tax=Diploscapter pachys TaxID=2018661 RepID=A0A2A2JBZ9_9BILA|nr:hypothetical protein WR25_09883 [Diploscapter pachys]
MGNDDGIGAPEYRLQFSRGSFQIAFDSALQFVVVDGGWSFTAPIFLEARISCREAIEPAVDCPTGSSALTECVVDKMVAVLKTALCVLSALAAILVMVLLAELAYRRLVGIPAVRQAELEDLKDELEDLKGELEDLKGELEDLKDETEAELKKAKANIVAYVDSAIESLKEEGFTRSEEKGEAHGQAEEKSLARGWIDFYKAAGNNTAAEIVSKYLEEHR